MATISNISVGLIARTSKFVKGMKRSGRAVKSFGASLLSVKSIVGGFGAALAGGIIIRGLTRMVKANFEAIDSLGKTADALGLTTEALAGFQLAAKIGGASVEDVDKALRRMAKNVSDANLGLTTAQRAFATMGLSAKELETLSMEDIFLRISDALPQIPKQTDKVRVALDLFGRSGVKMIKVMEGGSKSLKKFRQEGIALGIGLNRIDVAKVEQANDAMVRMGSAITGLTNQITIALAPIITDLADRFTAFAKSARIGSNDIIEGFKGIALAGARVLQGFELLKAGWLGLQFIIQKGLTGIIGLARIWFKVVSFAAKISPFTPQVVLDGIKKIDTVLGNMRENFSAVGDESGEAFAEAWENVLDEKAVKDVEKFFKKIQTRSQQAAEDIAKKVGIKPSGAPGAGAAKAGAQRTGAFRQVELSRIALGGTAGQRDNLVLDESKRQTALLRTIVQQGQVTRAN